MTPDKDLRELIGRYADGNATEAETRFLEAALRDDEELRREFLRYLNIDSALGSASLDGESSPPAEHLPLAGRDGHPDEAGRSRQRRPIAVGTAVGFLLGLIGTSLAWAITEARTAAQRERRVLLAETFDGPSGPLAGGFPQAAARWSGDEAEFLTLKGSNHPGEGVLRFLKPGSDRNDPRQNANSCDVFRIVDLRPFRAGGGDSSDRVLELAARFRDGRRERGYSVTFLCQMFLFEGDPAHAHELWPLNLGEAVSSAAELIDSPGGQPTTWIPASGRCFLSSRADFAVIQLGVRRNWPTVELGEQFADDVSLTLTTTRGETADAAR